MATPNPELDAALGPYRQIEQSVCLSSREKSARIHWIQQQAPNRALAVPAYLCSRARQRSLATRRTSSWSLGGAAFAERLPASDDRGVPIVPVTNGRSGERAVAVMRKVLETYAC